MVRSCNEGKYSFAAPEEINTLLQKLEFTDKQRLCIIY